MTYSGTYTVIGPPGTGKTTFLAKQVNKIASESLSFNIGGSSPVLVCSLTKTAAAEAAGRALAIKREAVSTLHSHGHRAMGAPPVAAGSLIEDSFNKDHPGMAITPEGLASDDDVSGVKSKQGTANGDEYCSKYHNLRHSMTPREMWPKPVLSFARVWEKWKEEHGVVDFTDMIEDAPDDAPLNPRVIIVDEAQDMSALEFDRLDKWAANAGAMIVCGDHQQALYTWRGAHPEYLMRDYGKDNFKILKRSWRVPRLVHARAVRWIKQLSDHRPIEYEPHDAEGLVRYNNSTYRDPYSAIDMAIRKADEGKTVMFVTACNYMCNPIVNELRHRGVPFSNPWRESNGSWNPIGKRKGISMSQRVESLLAGPRWTYKQMWEWCSCMKATGFMNRGAIGRLEERTKQHKDGFVTDEDIADWFVHGDMFEPTRWDAIMSYFESEGQPLHALFNSWMAGMKPGPKKSAPFVTNIVSKSGVQALKEPPRIHVGTIHSFKGAEADVVFLFPDLSAAGFDEWWGCGEGRDSIVRGFYVGMTRAKDELHLCQPATKRSVEF
jgi:superfamily I DNA/RNA helicase